MEKLKSSLVSDKLVVEAWLNATRYEGGKQHAPLLNRRGIVAVETLPLPHWSARSEARE
jgi:hypothetical protein